VIGDVAVKSMKRPVGRNLWVSGVCRRSNDDAILERACGLRGLADSNKPENHR